MKLELQQLEPCIHNVLSYSFDEKGSLHFHRFTQAQREIYLNEAEEWAMKCGSSASVTLDFVTDSDYIALGITLTPGSSQKWLSLDLYVDGVFCESRYSDNRNVKQVGFRLPEGEHRVTLYFPWSARTVVHEVHLSDGATIRPVSKKCKLLCFGDSITQGYCARYASLSYVNQVSRALDVEVVNQGIGGYYFNEATLDDSLLAYDPQLITVAYGTNDYSQHEIAQSYAANAERYIRKLAAMFPKAKILGILPLYRNDQNYQVRKIYRGYDMDDVRQILKELYLSLPNGYVLEQTGIPHVPEAYVADYLHPNDLGFSVMSRAIIDKLNTL